MGLVLSTRPAGQGAKDVALRVWERCPLPPNRRGAPTASPFCPPPPLRARGPPGHVRTTRYGREGGAQSREHAPAGARLPGTEGLWAAWASLLLACLLAFVGAGAKTATNLSRPFSSSLPTRARAAPPHSCTHVPAGATPGRPAGGQRSKGGVAGGEGSVHGWRKGKQNKGRGRNECVLTRGHGFHFSCPIFHSSASLSALKNFSRNPRTAPRAAAATDPTTTAPPPAAARRPPDTDPGVAAKATTAAAAATRPAA